MLLLEETGSQEPLNSRKIMTVGLIFTSALTFLDIRTPTRGAHLKRGLSKFISRETSQSGSHFLMEYQEANDIQS